MKEVLVMEKSYEQKVHYKMVIEGDYSCADMWAEDLASRPEDFHDSVLEYLYESFTELMNSPNFVLKLSDLRTKEEKS